MIVLEFHLNEKQGIVTVRPHGAMGSDDFGVLSEAVDCYLDRTGMLKGLIIDISSFPRWKSIDAFTAHLHFIQQHHKKVARVAVISHSAILSLFPLIADYFLLSEVKDFEDFDKAESWINELDL